MRRPASCALLLALTGLAAPGCRAQSVTLAGSMGADKALLVIDGQPQ
ncbi:MAG: hypothetical protein JNL87_20240, partial [Burkholderiaceae bacterium]|nr:hypothetical protein [Burkholderiaceae bacterium]